MATKISNLLNQAAEKLEKYDLGSALQLYREAMQLEPDNGAAAMGMAMVLNRNNQPGEALPLLRRIWAAVSMMKPKPAPEQTASVLAQMGLAQQLLGQVADALESYRHAARLVNSEDLDRRIKQLEPLANSPIPVQQLILHARQLHASRQHEEAIRTYRAALQLQADSAEALHGLAMTLRELRAVDEALPLMQKATVLAPDRAEYFNDLGMLFQDRSDFVKAISFHKRATRLFPNFVSAHINIGVAHKRLGQNEEALAAYSQALAINPSSPEAHNNLGNLLRLMGQLHPALLHLQKALEFKPGYPDAIANLVTLKKQLDSMPTAGVHAVNTKAGRSLKPAKTKSTPRKANKIVSPPKKTPAKTTLTQSKAARKKTVAKKAGPKQSTSKTAVLKKPAVVKKAAPAKKVSPAKKTAPAKKPALPSPSRLAVNKYRQTKPAVKKIPKGKPAKSKKKNLNKKK